MTRYRIVVEIEAGDQPTALSDVNAMSAAYTNKTLQIISVEERIT